ncbi:MAG: O-antigen ligase family protein [Bacteroidia bacterium]|nr:O-antigen ligase family protein [Bacteroidia bacterium]MBT8279221.1 O-antigen ligase family protein [Bacteroidia bacterium]NND25713.1 O-antigen ligase family protein [Flavobacteriaceae bacterium]NNK59757.1 O-antigen ligase family protein [Flavobacteriaceae bacterium]NNL32021.1 O-antigen ligase family protein [Flavobacteriaceae bacterium]
MLEFLKNNWVRTLFYIGLFLIGVSLLLPENFRNAALIAFAVAAFMSLLFGPKGFIVDKSILVYNSFFFIVMLISMVYTSNIEYGIKRIVVMLALIIIPVSFYIFHSKYDLNYSKILKPFYLLFFVSSILFFIAVFIQNHLNDHFNEFIFRDYSERLNSKYGKYSMHPIYASLYLSISLILTIPLYGYLKRKRHKILLVLGALFLTTILVLLTRKGIIAVTFSIFLVYFLRKQQKHNLLLYAFITILLAAITYNIPDLKNRYLEMLNVFLSGDLNKGGSTAIRLSIYDCTVNAIRQSTFGGYGIGDAKGVLSLCYEQSPDVFQGAYYNSHNQFFGAWLAAGIAGILSLLAMVFYNFKLALNRLDFVHVSIMVIFFFTMMTENVLERQNGAILFSFFINFFAFKNFQTEKNLD